MDSIAQRRYLALLVLARVLVLCNLAVFWKDTVYSSTGVLLCEYISALFHVIYSTQYQVLVPVKNTNTYSTCTVVLYNCHGAWRPTKLVPELQMGSTSPSQTPTSSFPSDGTDIKDWMSCSHHCLVILTYNFTPVLYDRLKGPGNHPCDEDAKI